MIGNKVYTVYLAEDNNNLAMAEIKVKAKDVIINCEYVMFKDNYGDTVGLFDKNYVIGYVRED